MNTTAKTAAYGAAGLAVASIVIFSGLALGVISPTSTGLVSILLTDPPSVPQGVTAVYLSYSGISLHAVGPGNSGWVASSGAGTIETLGLVNLSQTISSSKVPSLKYNLVAFDITSATVTYLGMNYSATVNGERVVVPVEGGLTVSSLHPSAALVDIQLTVLNLGEDQPRFVVAAGAKALQVPSGEVSDHTEDVGYRFGLSDQGWYQDFSANHSNNVTISGVNLTPNAFSFSAKNSGQDPVVVRLILISPASGGHGSETMSTPANSLVFVVEQNGTLKLVTAGHYGADESAFEGAGFEIGAGTSMTFSYSGSLTTLASNGAISSGVTYDVVFLGSHTLIMQTVKSA